MEAYKGRTPGPYKDRFDLVRVKHRNHYMMLGRKNQIQCLRWILFLALHTTPIYTYACLDGSAVISGNALYPPLSWERNGKLTGVSVQTVTNILNEQKISAIIGNPAPWKRLVHRAKLGEIDILLGARKNHEWEHFLEYTEPALTPSVQGVFYFKDREINYEDWHSLKRKPGGILRGASFGEKFDNYAKEHLSLQEANALNQNFLKLKKGRIQFFLAPLVPTQLYIKQAGLEGEILNTEKPLLAINEYIAISKRSSCIKHADYISKRIKEMIEHNDIDQIMEDYFFIWFEDVEKNTKLSQ